MAPRYPIPTAVLGRRPLKYRARSLDYASDLGDLSSPGNNLEKLKGALSGKYSIRVNDQLRIVFNFERGEATNVIITDYHR